MTTPSNARSVKISDDERTGWSSDRPRREGSPPRPADISVRCTVLTPSAELRYAPGSLLVVVSAVPDEARSFAARVTSERGALLSLHKIRGLLAGRVPDDELEARAAELLEGAARKRLEAGETVILTTDGLDREERDPIVRLAAQFKRPRHLILVEPSGTQLEEGPAAALADLRRRLAAAELGSEGIQTALRVAGTSIAEVKRIDFRPAPRDD